MEYQLAPSPIRASYLGSQALNPVQSLKYGKLLYRGLWDGQTVISNTTTERSLFDFFSASTMSNEVFGGPSILVAGETNSRLLFPPNFFQRGDFLKITLMGEMSNAALGQITFKQFGWNLEENYGTNTIELSTNTDANVALGDLNGTFSLTWLIIFRWFGSANQVVAQHILHGIYRNANAIDGYSLFPRITDTIGNQVLDEISFLRYSVQWSAASASNSLSPYCLTIEHY